MGAAEVLGGRVHQHAGKCLARNSPERKITVMKKAAFPVVSYAQALGHASADKRIEILRLIGHSGSISKAAREAGVSYKAAWQAIDTLTNLAGVALVERAVGGAGGGGASLSDAGLQLLAAAGQLEQARCQVLARLQPDAGLGTGPDSGAGLRAGAGTWGLPSLNQLSVRTSMRNQLPCQVYSLQGTGHIVRVTLKLKLNLTLASSVSLLKTRAIAASRSPGALADVSLVSHITRESAELLALRPGQAVLALCKATAVTVSRAATLSRTPSGKALLASAPASALVSAGNVLAGRATRVSRGETGDEVSLALSAGLQLVGFAPPGSGIRVGSKVLAHVDEAAVVVALAG